ncbi:RICIN domain-containing protein [Streptosporangium sp. NPDC004379]|uniref:RICIN domain-containing protein n=1 Tax=Streptosporangium sp. NPDC004379 TaxID=3366189 RepID=UPI00368F08C8
MTVHRRALTVTALLASAFPALASLPPALPASARPAQLTVLLVNLQTGRCLTIAGGVSAENNVQAVQYTCDTHPSRRWFLNDVTGTGQYQVRNANTGKCLTIAGGVSTANNVTAVQYTCDSNPSRRWTLIDVTGNGRYQVRNAQTGKCLTIAGGVSTANNVTAVQYDCDDHPSRRWTLNLTGAL